ncbi:MAG TPA: hypothetical protein VLR44_06945 [Rhodoferax sp.]|nr:hypothetical protein [Rhodoferax sp.]
MEYQYTDIEAHIRRANRLRSEALGEILSVGFHKCVQFFNGLVQRKFQKSVVAARSSPAVFY